MTTCIDPNLPFPENLSIAVDDDATIVDCYADETEETIVIEVARKSDSFNLLHEIFIACLDERGINWQSITAEQLSELCLDEEIGIYAHQVKTFGPKVIVPTVDEVISSCELRGWSGDEQILAWGVEGGEIAVPASELRIALEAAYDPAMPDWPGMAVVDDGSDEDEDDA